MRTKPLLSVFINLAMMGCAFREPAAVPPGSQAPLSEAPQSKGTHSVRSVSAKLGWIGKDGVAHNAAEVSLEEQSSGKAYLAKAPYLIPAEVPDELEIQLPQNEVTATNAEQLEVFASFSPNSSAKSILSIQDVQRFASADSITSTVVRLKGLRQLLRSNEEGRAYVRLLSRDQLKSLEFVLTTPPSKIESKQLIVAAHEAENGPLPEGSKNLVTIGLRLQLLQVLSISIRSELPVTVSLPLQIEGSLQAQLKKTTLSESFCNHSLSRTEWTENLSEGLYLVPILPEMNTRFVPFLNEHVAHNDFELTLQPGETSLVGIYGSGKATETIGKGAYILPPLITAQAVTSCRSRCGGRYGDMNNWDYNKTATRFWSQAGWPGASEICSGLYPAWRASPDVTLPNEDALNKCAEWELSNGVPPWHERRFCQSPASGNPWNYPAREFWYVTKNKVTVSVGTERGPVYLRLKPGSVDVSARFSLDGQPEAPSRQFSNLIQLETKQLD